MGSACDGFTFEEDTLFEPVGVASVISVLPNNILLGGGALEAACFPTTSGGESIKASTLTLLEELF